MRTVLRLKLLVISSFVLFAGSAALYTRPSVTVASTAEIPSAPSDVAASDGDYISKIGLMWSAVRGATNYRIYRSTNDTSSGAVEIGTTQTYQFFDPGVVQGQVYFYWVRAENSFGSSALSPSERGNAAVGSLRGGGLQPLEPPQTPQNNPLTAAKAYLGKTLFWDERLSSTDTVSCGTCHRPAAGGSDPRTLFGDPSARAPGVDLVMGTPDDTFGSRGVPANGPDGLYTFSASFGFGDQVTSRKAPSYLNGGFSPNGLFWDGRATNVFRDPLSDLVLMQNGGALESQAAFPPLDAKEMAHSGANWAAVAQKVSSLKPLSLAEAVPDSLAKWIGDRSYPELFEEAFGTPEVTPARILLAIATHERVLFTDRTPLDRHLQSIENLPAQQQRGLQVFNQQQCGNCHGGGVLSNQRFENVGVVPQNDDPGRAGVTGNPAHRAQFKVPSLRNVGLRAPYMHTGKLPSLEAVVAFYNRGGDFDGPNIDRNLIHPLNLNQDQQNDLVAFLRFALTDPRVAGELPPFDRPKLYSESSRVPVTVGTGRAGSGGVVPVPIAKEPPFVGNGDFTVAVSAARAGAQAVVVIGSADPGIGTTIPQTASLSRQVTTVGGQGTASLNIPIPTDASVVGKTFYGRWYVTDADAANGFSVSPAFRFTVFGEGGVRRRASNDFDGDGKTDIAVFRPSNGEWWYRRSSDSSAYGATFGTGADKPATADFTGDGRTDIAFFRPSSGTWYVLRSEDGTFYAFPFGSEGDIPVPSDYDGDGTADAAVFRPSTGYWYMFGSSSGASVVRFGASGDVPQPADYDGDGRTDQAVFRPNGREGAEWWVLRSTAGLTAATFGAASDVPTAGDYTGDGKADMAFYRPVSGSWFVLRSEGNGYYSAPFGDSSDRPVPGDYDGDGMTDFAVFRSSQGLWYINQSSFGVGIASFGIGGDVTPHLSVGSER